MTGLCIKAADLLEKIGIDAEVVHLASIKPIDHELIAATASRTGCAVTAENASIIGGFGAAVAEVLAETVPIPMARIGVRDRFVNSGGTGDLFRIHQMLPEDIAQAAQTVLQRKSRMLSVKDDLTSNSHNSIGQSPLVDAMRLFLRLHPRDRDGAHTPRNS